MTLAQLDAYAALRSKLYTAMETLESLELSAYPGGGGMDGMPKAPGKVGDKVGSLAIEIADWRARVRHIEKCINEECTEAIDYIDSIDNNQTRLAFRLRFMRCLSWEDVARIMGGEVTEGSVRKMVYRYLEGGSACIRQ